MPNLFQYLEDAFDILHMVSVSGNKLDDTPNIKQGNIDRRSRTKFGMTSGIGV
ncbi:MAG: hypothetical protein RIC35_24370 [Marinoscillum sp.]